MTPDDTQARIAAYQRKLDQFDARIAAMRAQWSTLRRAGQTRRADALFESIANLSAARERCFQHFIALDRPARPATTPPPDPLAGLPLFAGMEVSR